MLVVSARRNWLTGLKIAISSVLVLWSNLTLAQATPDTTLGAESSVVTPDVEIRGVVSDRVDGGAIRGANLFHSFREFNVGEGRGVYFTNPQGIENILSRVTGANRSEILGRLGVLGNANLFLISPNGIVFGQNASLDIEGSFVATTANAIRLGETGLFSATDPASSNLLSINPSALFYNVLAKEAAIVNRSQAGLNVPDGRSLLLVGGKVTLESGVLKAPGGRVELGGLDAPGTIALSQDGNNLGLSFPEGVGRADVLLTKSSSSSNGSEVSVRAGGNGSIGINARNVEISGGSALRGGIGSRLGSVDAVAGDITLNATGTIEVKQQSVIKNNVNTRAVGKAGEINVNTGSLLMKNGARVNVGISGNGDGGTVNINAQEEVVLDGVASNNLPTSILSNVEEGAKGNAGDINIKTGTLLVTNGALLESQTRGEGNGGNLSIDAIEKVELIGNSSGFFAQVNSNAKGDGGNLRIFTRQFLVRDGADVSVSTFGEGNGGNLTINAVEKVEVIGSGSRLSAQVNSNAKGNVGDLRINTREFLVQDGADVSVSTFGEGNGGNLTINAIEKVELIGSDSRLSAQVNSNGKGNGGDLSINTRQFLVLNGADVSVSTFGEGNGGNLSIDAIEKVELIGDGSGLFAQVNPNAKGNGGDLSINTRQFLVLDGADVSVSTFGEGNGGNLSIDAIEKVELIGDGSRLSAQVNSNGKGNGGDLSINTHQFLVRDGADVSVSTFGVGDGGNLTINAAEKVELIGDGSGLFAQVNPNARGNGGDLSINTRQFLVRDAGGVNVSTLGGGNGGNLTINAAEKVELIGGGSRLSAQANSNTGGNGGDINITTGALLMTNGAELTVVTAGEGNSGNINIKADQFSMTENAALMADLGVDGQGRGGNINLDIQGQILLVGGKTAPTGESTRITISVFPRGKGSGGNINIRASSFMLQDGAIIKNSTQGEGNVGDIFLNADVVNISGSVPSSGLPSGLFTSTNTDFAAGNITINTLIFQIAEGAALSARSRADGTGGNIRVDTGLFEAINGGQLITTAFGKGQAGDIFINAENQIVISGSDPNYTERLAKFPNPISLFIANDIKETGSNSGLFANTEPNSIGKGGNIGIQGDSLTLKNSQMNARTQGQGIAGSININVNGLLSATDSDITTAAQQSSGGTIAITAGDIRLYGDSDIAANVASGAGGGGNITLRANSIIAFDDSDIFAFDRDGKGGNITLNTPVFFGQNYKRDPSGTAPYILDENNRVDIYASGAISSDVTIITDTSFFKLPQNLIDTSSLIANSCIARSSRQQEGSFTITGSGSLPSRPGEALMSQYTFGIVRTVSNTAPSVNSTRRPWQKGDPIVEPLGVYRLSSGQLVLSRECSD